MRTQTVKNLKIALILHPYGEKHATGLGRVAFSLSKVLIKNHPQHFFTVFVKGNNSQTPDFDGNNWKLVRLISGRLLFDLHLRKFSDSIDVFVFFTPVIPLFFYPKKSIIMAHDFSYERFFPRGLRAFLKRKIIHFIHSISIEKAKKIIAVSNYTRQEIYKYFNVPREKVVLIYNGYDNIDFSKINAIEKANKPFFLSIGTLKERKNQLNIVRAFIKFKKTDNFNFSLIIVGKKGGKYYKKMLTTVEKTVFKHKILFLDHVSNAERSFLYKNATGLVYPSLLEGFGLPILEAMGCGLPVITSNIGALKEVASDSALLVNPYDISNIAKAMETLSIHNDKREELIKKGFERSKMFSWEKTADKIINLIKDINEKSDK